MDAMGQAVLDALDCGVVVLDPAGRLLYVNPAARRSMPVGDGWATRERLLSAGARAVPLIGDGRVLGEALLFPAVADATLAERERQAILGALAATGGHLVEAARRLGISRTTLWRRLKTYGGNARPGAAS